MCWSFFISIVNGGRDDGGSRGTNGSNNLVISIFFAIMFKIESLFFLQVEKSSALYHLIYCRRFQYEPLRRTVTLYASRMQFWTPSWSGHWCVFLSPVSSTRSATQALCKEVCTLRTQRLLQPSISLRWLPVLLPVLEMLQAILVLGVYCNWYSSWLYSVTSGDSWVTILRFITSNPLSIFLIRFHIETHNLRS